MKSISRAFGFLFVVALTIPPAKAEESGESGPREKDTSSHAAPVSADLLLEWQNEYRSNSDDKSIDGTNNSFVRAELLPRFNLNDQFYINAHFTFEPFDQAADVNAGDDIWFDREGAYVEELNLNYENGPWAVWVGKFDPNFGVAWDIGRGIWSEDFAQDYQLTEKIGAGGSYTVETPAMGEHTLAFSTFFTDTSFLSRGVITSRGRTRLSDGGAGNTEDFSSYVVSLNGENTGGVENLSYILAFRHQGEQDKNQSSATSDENGWDATLRYVIPSGENLSFDVLGEYAGLRDFEGVKNADRDYYSASVVTKIYKNWNVTAGYTFRDVQDDGTGVGSTDNLFQLTGGYDFNNGLTAEAGWRSTDEADVDTNILGFLLRYQRSF